MLKKLLLWLVGAALLLVACGGGTSPPDLSKAPTGGDQPKAGTIAPSAEHETEQASATHCGYERWAPKTGQDATASQVSLTPKPSTIAALSLYPSPLPPQKGSYPPQINTRKAPHEFEDVTIKVTVLAYRSENDSDIHLVVSDGQHHTMITEIPNPSCLANLAGAKNTAASPWVTQITAARNAFLAKTGYKPVVWTSGKTPPPFIKANLSATITGVVFFDWPHNQYGAAKTTAVEIHPILAITFP